MKIKPVLQDRGKVELSDAALIRHWTKKFAASQEEISAAIEKVGDNPETVAKEISNATGSCSMASSPKASATE